MGWEEMVDRGEWDGRMWREEREWDGRTGRRAGWEGGEGLWD
jgi:hypothetical protein